MNSQAYPGARWWKFDFHTHTPASSDYGAGSNQEALLAITHRDWLANFIRAGIECIAITDHHCGDWIDPLKRELVQMNSEDVRGAQSLHLFPGVELSISGIHYLAIFGEDATSQTIKDLLARARYDGNKHNAHGICSEMDPVKVCAAVAELGGIFIPAHVDLESTGLFRSTQSGALKPLFECDEIVACETAGNGYQMPGVFAQSGVNWTKVLGSDSHHPSPRPDGSGRYPGSHFSWVKMGLPSIEALRLALLDGNGSGLQRSDEQPSGYDPNEEPDLWIESLEVTQAQFMGRPSPATYGFSPWLNSVIGGRGSGKSTLVHFIRLVGRRESDLTQIPAASRVREAFSSFTQIDNGLLGTTEATLVYRKGAERYRLLWKQQDGGTTVENWNEMIGDWISEDSQEVTTRFPLTIFSQDQIGALAENSQAILQRIDEAINKPDWQRRWDEELASYLKHLTEARRLRGQLAEKDRLSGQLTDLNKKLEIFEKSEHADILKTARRFQKQQSEFVSLLEAHTDRISGLEDFTENFLLYDLPSDLIDDTNIDEGILTEVDKSLRTSIAKASEILLQVAEDLKTANTDARRMLNESDWQKARKSATEKYTALVNDLKEKGVNNPNEFSTLVVEKQTIESKLKKLQNLAETINQHLSKAQNSADRMLSLRQELQDLRKNFLDTNLANNPFVRISLVPYGAPHDLKSAEESLRGFLGCQDGRFASSIISEDVQYGILGGLYRELPRESDEARKEEIEKRLSEWKSVVRASAEGITDELILSKPFASFLQRSFEANPESIFRLESWWPEDSLEVSYSKGSEGRSFTPLANGSAGEKAAALLAFFLAYGDAPLIIDQPENDLDNHLITDLVVKQLQNNKTRRQIIVVTHNPNIVVNGDAEMVHAMGFKNGQCQPIAQGALQNPKVRSEVCNVMEGGEHALEKRYQRLIS